MKIPPKYGLTSKLQIKLKSPKMSCTVFTWQHSQTACEVNLQSNQRQTMQEFSLPVCSMFSFLLHVPPGTTSPPGYEQHVISHLCPLSRALSSGQRRAEGGKPETEGREWSFNPGYHETVQVRRAAGRTRRRGTHTKDHLHPGILLTFIRSSDRMYARSFVMLETNICRD